MFDHSHLPKKLN